MNDRSLQALEQARSGLGSGPSHGQVVAALPFGFWTKLSHRDRTALFWNPILNNAFPTSPSRGEVHQLVARINTFRNRLAHSEPVFSNRTGLMRPHGTAGWIHCGLQTPSRLTTHNFTTHNLTTPYRQAGC